VEEGGEDEERRQWGKGRAEEEGRWWVKGKRKKRQRQQGQRRVRLLVGAGL
jgi:hypothetical protein